MNRRPERTAALPKRSRTAGAQQRVRAVRVRGRLRATALALVAALGFGVLAGCGDAGHDGTGHAETGAAETAAPRLKVRDAFLPEPITTATAAVYGTIENTGGPDTLTSVTTNLAAEATLHTTRDGTMRERPSLPVPAHGSLVLDRGGNHVMLTKLTRKPRVGDTVRVRLHFRRTGPVDIEVPVKPATHNPGHPSHHSGHHQHNAGRSHATPAPKGAARAPTAASAPGAAGPGAPSGTTST